MLSLLVILFVLLQNSWRSMNPAKQFTIMVIVSTVIIIFLWVVAWLRRKKN